MVEEKTIKDINNSGYDGFVEWLSGFYFLKPVGAQLSDIFHYRVRDISGVFRSKKSHDIFEPRIISWRSFNNNVLDTVEGQLEFGRNIKVIKKDEVLHYARHIQPTWYLINDIKKWVNKDFEEDVVNTVLTSSDKKEVSFIATEEWKLDVASGLVYKLIKLESPFSKKVFPVLFKPSQLLKSDNDLWKVTSILGEEFFSKELIKNNFVINRDFIINSFKKSKQVYYISRRNKKVFATSSELVKDQYKDLEEIPLHDLLEYLDVNQIEHLLERGDLGY